MEKSGARGNQIGASHNAEPSLVYGDRSAYVGGMSDEVNVHLHFHGLDGLLAIALADRQFLRQILTNTERLLQMSGTLSEQLDAATAAIKADVQAVSDEVTKLLAGLTPGTTITQAQVDALTAIDASLKAIPPAP